MIRRGDNIYDISDTTSFRFGTVVQVKLCTYRIYNRMTKRLYDIGRQHARYMSPTMLVVYYKSKDAEDPTITQINKELGAIRKTWSVQEKRRRQRRAIRKAKRLLQWLSVLRHLSDSNEKMEQLKTLK